MAFDESGQINTVIGFLVGVIAMVSAVATLFKYKWNQSINSAKFKLVTTADIEKLMKSISDLCRKIDEMQKEQDTKMDKIEHDLEKRVVTSREEHAAMQVNYHELVKELYKLIGQVTALKDNNNNN